MDRSRILRVRIRRTAPSTAKSSFGCLDRFDRFDRFDRRESFRDGGGFGGRGPGRRASVRDDPFSPRRSSILERLETRRSIRDRDPGF